MTIREHDIEILPTINHLISLAASDKIDLTEVERAGGTSFSDSFRKTILENMPLAKLSSFKNKFSTTLIELETDLSKTHPKQVEQSLRYGVLKSLNEVNDSGVIYKAYRELDSESVELKIYLQQRVKAEIPSQFHQFINICQTTIEDLLSAQDLTITRSRAVKKKIEDQIESLKYSCLFNGLGTKVLKILPEMSEGVVPVEKLKDISEELYYLVCYEAMTKFLEVVSEGQRSLKMTTLKDYIIEDLGFVQKSSSPAEVYVKIIEASTRRSALTINKSESAASELKRIMEKNEDMVQEEYRKFVKEYKNSQKASFIPASGQYRGLKFEGIGLDMLSHEKLFEHEVRIHEEKVQPHLGDAVSKYRIIDTKDRAWETNSIIVDLTRHVKESKVLSGEITGKFRVSVTVFSRCAVYKRAPIVLY